MTITSPSATAATGTERNLLARVGGAAAVLAAGTFGYGIAPTGVHDAATGKTIAAFQRHWRPARVDGRIDSSTLATAERLVATAAMPATS